MPEVDPRDKRYVPPSGSPEARIVILGEAPGINEEQQKKPFVGANGQLLFNNLLYPIGVRRENCFILNVIPIKLPNNDLRALKGMNINIESCIKDARDMIDAHPRDIILAVGDLALRACTGLRGIMKWHGSYLKAWNGVTCIPTIHPAACLREFNLVTLCRMDMKKMKFWMENPDYDSNPRTLYTVHQTVRKSIRTRQAKSQSLDPDWYIAKLQEARRGKILSFDIETSVQTITVFGFAASTSEAISIPFTSVFAPYDEARIIESIRKLLACPIPKVTQNGIYDSTYLAEKWGIEIRGMLWDTMLMHHCLYSELRHSLAALTAQYTFEPFYKEMAKDVNSPDYSNQHWEYNALDTAITLEVFESLYKELESNRLLDFYMKHYVPLSHSLARIQQRGLPMDVDEKERLKIQIERDLTRQRSELKHMIGHEIPNVTHGESACKLIYGELKLPVQRDRITQRPTAKESALRTLMRNHPSSREVLQLILDIRANAKLLSTYLHKTLESPDGRVRCSYNIAGDSRKPDSRGGTETGRLSSSVNPFGFGTNLQNQPSTTKSMFRAPDGWEFWQADLSAAESYVVAWCSGDERMLDILTQHRLFRPGFGDKVWIHEETGVILTGISREKIIGEIRQLAKRVRHGWSYNMKAPTLTITVNNELPSFPFDSVMAKECISKLDRAHPGVINWWRDTRETIMRTRTLVNCFGRRRVFLGRLDDTTFRSGYSTLPQNEVSDHLYLSLTKINHHCESVLGEDKAKVLGTVHDSIMGVCRVEEVGNLMDFIKETMESPLPRERDGFKLRIPVETKHGKTWKECV